MTILKMAGWLIFVGKQEIGSLLGQIEKLLLFMASRKLSCVRKNIYKNSFFKSN